MKVPCVQPCPTWLVCVVTNVIFSLIRHVFLFPLYLVTCQSEAADLAKPFLKFYKNKKRRLCFSDSFLSPTTLPSSLEQATSHHLPRHRMYDIECLRDFQILLRWTIFSCSSHMIIFVDFFFLNYTKEEWIFVWGSNPNPGKNVYFIEMPHFFVLARIFFFPRCECNNHLFYYYYYFLVYCTRNGDPAGSLNAWGCYSHADHVN